MMDHDDITNRSDLICFVGKHIKVQLKDGHSQKLELICNEYIPAWHSSADVDANGFIKVIVKIYEGQYK